MLHSEKELKKHKLWLQNCGTLYDEMCLCKEGHCLKHRQLFMHC